VTEVRSYRRVFDLERRIYSVEQIRLNPSGVPVRGIVYFLFALAAALLAARLPVLNVVVRLLPWFLRDLALPAVVAAALTAIRIDGRTFHHAARGALSYWASPRRTVALAGPSRRRGRWHPGEILFVPDGSEARVRRCRYRGPGTVAILVRHRGEVRRRHAVAPPRAQREIVLLTAASGARLRRARVLELDRRTSLLVDLDRRDGRR
jgi:hypothetical protein